MRLGPTPRLRMIGRAMGTGLAGENSLAVKPAMRSSSLQIVAGVKTLIFQWLGQLKAKVGFLNRVEKPDVSVDKTCQVSQTSRRILYPEIFVTLDGAMSPALQARLVPVCRLNSEVLETLEDKAVRARFRRKDLPGCTKCAQNDL